jgi:hypothetical protein
MTAEKYVGVAERNPWEGETFGHYWPWSEEAERLLREVVARYHAEQEKSVRLEIKTHEELVALDDADHNGYMARVTVYEVPESWKDFVSELAPAGVMISDDDYHPFYKGRGLPRDRKVKNWR